LFDVVEMLNRTEAEGSEILTMCQGQKKLWFAEIFGTWLGQPRNHAGHSNEALWLTWSRAWLMAGPRDHAASG
jgi:hypothetical protein